MITHPKAEELVEAVIGWIDGIRPQLDPRNAFLARVAANALGAVRRELALGEPAEAAAVVRLSEVLGVEGDFDMLTAELCQRLRDGRADAATPGLVAALKANVLDQLAIDQPTYRHEG